MNCPAKTDDAVSEHPTWSQSPPFLAADLTTCRDLNGISNSREHRNGSEVAGGWFGVHDKKLDSDVSPSGQGITVGDPGNTVALQGSPGSNSRARLLVAGHTPSLSRFWNWIVWAASVLVCSFLLSAFQNNHLRFSARLHQEQEAETKPLTTHSSSLRLRSTCSTGGARKEAYNIPLHVGALFIILFISTAACTFPLLAIKFPSLRIRAPFFFVVRHFGTGVLIATAFVHLLPTAFILLGDPCLSNFWINDYPAIPGAIALAGVFFVIIIEMVFHPSRRANPTPNAACPGAESDSGQPVLPRANKEALPTKDVGQLGEPSGTSNSLPNAAGQGSSHQIQVAGVGGCTGDRRAEVDAEKGSHNGISPVLTLDQKLQKDILQCILLEVGILFHSVFIGMALSVSVANEFIVLLIAIAFHQTFEGLALGSRIANIAWPNDTLQPWFMAIAYGCTTPIGQAVGIATSSLYSPDSEVGLILVGTMNAISSGLLVFASLVELLSEDFLSHESWRVLRGKQRGWACLFVFLGAFCMSLVGAWA